MDMILIFLKRIFYYIEMFFFAEAPFTHIFKIVFIAQIVFLITAAFRPQNWKFILLFISELIYVVGGIAVFSQGVNRDDVFMLFYGIIAAVVALITFFCTLWCMCSVPDKAKSSAEE